MLQPLPGFAVLHDLVYLASLLHWVTGHNLPVVEHTLWESLATSVGPQVGSETEGLVDRQVGLDHKHWGSGSLSLLENMSSPSV